MTQAQWPNLAIGAKLIAFSHRGRCHVCRRTVKSPKYNEFT